MRKESIRAFVERATERACNWLADKYGVTRERCAKELIALSIAFVIAVVLVIGTLYAIVLFGHEQVGRVALIAVFATGFFVYRGSLAEALRLLAAGITRPLPYFLILLPVTLFASSLVLSEDAVKDYTAVRLALIVLLAYVASVACAYRVDRPYKDFMDLLVGDPKKNPVAFAAALVSMALPVSLAVLMVLAPHSPLALALVGAIVVTASALVGVTLTAGVLSSRSRFASAVLSSLLRIAGLVAYIFASLAVLLAASYFAGAIRNLRDIEAVGVALLLSLLCIACALEEGRKRRGVEPGAP